MDKLVRKIEVPLAKNIIKKSGLYLIQKKDFNKVCEVATNSFKNYPLHLWFCDWKYNDKIVRLIFKTSLKIMFKDALIYADSEEINGFAIWLPIGFTGTKTLPFLLHGGFKLFFLGRFKLINKLIKYEELAMSLKQKYTNHEDWYLYNLSVKEDSQGKGIGSKIMKPMLRFCDLEQMVCYLETNKDTNIGMYEHFGFKLEEKVLIPNSEVWHYAFTRQPQ